jgi:hypothetical protein
VIKNQNLTLAKEIFIMKLYEEFKLYESLWESAETFAVVFVGNRRNQKALLDKVAKTNPAYTTTVFSVSDFLRQYENSNKDVVKFYTDAEGKAELEQICADMPERMRKSILNAATLIESVKTAVLPSDGYRVVLADYDTDDFDINVEFDMQDPDENEVVDYEYLLKPGQTRGDLVVYLSDNCGFTSIYVHDERPATATDVKRLSSETFPVTDTGDEYKYYGDID